MAFDNDLGVVSSINFSSNALPNLPLNNIVDRDLELLISHVAIGNLSEQNKGRSNLSI